MYYLEKAFQCVTLLYYFCYNSLIFEFLGDEIVIKNKYLFFGDNREMSLDARKWENLYIDSKDIEGKAQFITYPFKRFGKFIIGKDALNH